VVHEARTALLIVCFFDVKKRGFEILTVLGMHGYTLLLVGVIVALALWGRFGTRRFFSQAWPLRLIWSRCPTVRQCAMITAIKPVSPGCAWPRLCFRRYIEKAPLLVSGVLDYWCSSAKSLGTVWA
jgi:hypothetical protein